MLTKVVRFLFLSHHVFSNSFLSYTNHPNFGWFVVCVECILIHTIHMTSDQILAGVVTEIINPIYQLLVALSLVYFVYGVARYIIDLSNPEKKTYRRQHLLYGTLGLFIVVTIGAFISFLNGIFGSLFFS